ncbi:MAG: hypothetical protein RQ761_05325 [Bacteroidales bacterium]|nr:hypothetical protein [Bacteroidales bacterium]
MESAEKFIEKIKEGKIKPRPRWRFTIPNVGMWILMFVSVIAGAVAFSIILFAIQQIDFDLIAHMSHSRFEWWLGLLPFLWIITLIIFIAFSVFGLRYTRKGYKYSLKSLIAINIGFSILTGSLFFIGGGAGWLEEVFAENIKIYESVQAKKMKMWSLPEEGYLAGYLLQINDSSAILKDFNEKEWLVDIRTAVISQAVDLEKDELVKLIGRKLSNKQFLAEEVRPWGGFGRGRNRNNPPG